MPVPVPVSLRGYRCRCRYRCTFRPAPRGIVRTWSRRNLLRVQVSPVLEIKNSLSGSQTYALRSDARCSRRSCQRVGQFSKFLTFTHHLVFLADLYLDYLVCLTISLKKLKSEICAQLVSYWDQVEIEINIHFMKENSNKLVGYHWESLSFRVFLNHLSKNFKSKFKTPKKSFWPKPRYMLDD